MENDIEGHDELQLMIGEEALAPSTQLPRSMLELVVEDMNRLGVSSRILPSRLDHVQEARHPDPEVLESEGGWTPGAALA